MKKDSKYITINNKDLYIPGAIIRLKTSSMREPYRLYLLEIVEGTQIVYKYFGKHKQWWHYEIISFNMLQFYCEFEKDDRFKYKLICKGQK